MPRMTMALVCVFLTGCKGVASEEAARLAYEGLDPAVATMLQLGFDGFNAADSANIDPQTADGLEAGTITVTGQVDQGNSDNKGMRLLGQLVDWTDGPVTSTEDEQLAVAYSTGDEAPLDVDFSLRDIPDGTLEGSIVGTVWMVGDLEDELTLDLTLDGTVEDDGAGGTQRTVGATTVVGTATSGYGTFAVDLTL